MKWLGALVGLELVVRAAEAQGVVAQDSPSRAVAATVIKMWAVLTTVHPGAWGYEEGVLLDGMAAERHSTADGADFKYIKTAVDKYVTDHGTIAEYKADGHTLDDIAMGRGVLLVYRVAQQAKYYKAAKFLNEQLALRPRTASGGYWHKQIYPNQWLDGLIWTGEGCGDRPGRRADGGGEVWEGNRVCRGRSLGLQRICGPAE
jgi:unsaturated rhamnogalacturonyl hydrolase